MFTPIKSTKVYEQVIYQIKKMVTDGTLKRGDKLPSERELTEQLKVSRTSIREALRAMEIIGLVECKQGEGNFICNNFENNLFEPLSIMFMLHESNPTEIIELRRVMEVETAALAAERVSQEELDDMSRLIELMKNSNDEELSIKLDKQFHYMIARSSQNILIVSMLNAVSYLIDSFIKGARGKILMHEGNREVLARQHENIYLALLKHDSKGAVEAMKNHMDFTNKYIMK